MGHLSMIVFQKCVVMPRIFGGYWGALLTLRLISWQRKNWVFQPNNKIKISVQKVNFNCFGKSLKTPPDEHPISFSWTINTKGHTLSLHLRKIHFFIIDSFCLYYVIHPFSTDTMVLSISAAPPWDYSC